VLADVERTVFFAAPEEERVIPAIRARRIGGGLQLGAFVGVRLEGVDLRLAAEEAPARGLAAAARAAIEDPKRFAGEQRVEKMDGDVMHQAFSRAPTRRAGFRWMGSKTRSTRPFSAKRAM